MEKTVQQKIEDLIKVSGDKASKYDFRGKIPERPNGLAMRKWVTGELKEINECIDEVEKECGLKAVCKKGCSYCCQQLIVIINSEIPAIESYISNLSRDEKRALKENVDKLCLELERNGITAKSVSNPYQSFVEQQVLQKKYFDLHLNCIFLNDDASCNIHDFRPALCWAYREYESADKCKDSCFSDTGFKFDDWERRQGERIIKAKPMKGNLSILPFAIRDILK